MFNKKLRLSGYENLQAIVKEITYQTNSQWFEIMQELIDHNLIQADSVEPQVIIQTNSSGYELTRPIVFKIKLPERIKQLENENEDLKNKINVYKDCLINVFLKIV